jgi:polyribonucleotide nucleotidyltransferase
VWRRAATLRASDASTLRSVFRRFVDIQITDHQNVDIQITDWQNVDIQIIDHQNVDIQITDRQNVDIYITNHETVDVKIRHTKMYTFLINLPYPKVTYPLWGLSGCVR